jgi:hypothetical protein
MYLLYPEKHAPIEVWILFFENLKNVGILEDEKFARGGNI